MDGWQGLQDGAVRRWQATDGGVRWLVPHRYERAPLEAEEQIRPVLVHPDGRIEAVDWPK